MATKTKEELADRMREAEQRDLIEANRAARVERQLQNKTQLVRERAAADAAARAGPVVPPAVPVIPDVPPVVPANQPHRHYREVRSRLNSAPRNCEHLKLTLEIGTKFQTLTH